jgi:hypothetical protein
MKIKYIRYNLKVLKCASGEGDQWGPSLEK